MLTRRFLFSLLYSFFICISWTQQVNYSAYLTKDNGDKIEYAEELVNFYLSENIDSVLVVGENLFFYGLDQGYPPAKEQGKIFIAEYFIQTGKIQKGLELLKPMLNVAEEQKDNHLKIAVTNRITLGYCKAQDAKSALIWAKRLQELKRNETDVKRKIEGDLLLAQAFLLNKKNDEAISIYTNYIQTAKTIQFHRGLASAYAKLGDIYRTQGNIKKAKAYFLLSFQSGKKSALTTPQANAINNLAIINFEENQLDEALDKFKQGLTLRQKANNFRGICESLFNLGEYYFYNEDYARAEQFYKESEEFASKHELLADQRDALKGMTACRKGLKDFETATIYQDKIIALQQEIVQLNLEDDEELSRLEREIWKNDHQLINPRESTSTYKMLTWIFGATSFILFILLFITRKKTNSISLEKPIEK